MNAPINRSILMQRANNLAKKLGKKDFKATDRWLTRWKEMHSIVYKKVHGKKQDTDETGASEQQLSHCGQQAQQASNVCW